jgi:hypothetical protein
MGAGGANVVPAEAGLIALATKAEVPTTLIA